MNFKVFIIFVATLLFSVNCTVAQKARIDSLEARLQYNYANSSDYSINLPILSELFSISSLSSPYLALEYAGQALQITVGADNLAGQAEWNQKIADIYFDQKVYYMAMENYFEAYQIFKQLDMKKETAIALMNIGDTYFIQSVEDVSLSYYVQADSIFSKINYQKGMAKVKNKIGMVELELFQYDKAMAMFDESFAISKSLNDQNLMAETLANKAKTYDQNEDYENEEKYIVQAITKYRMGGDRLSMAKCYYQAGEMYFKNEEYDRAYINYLRSRNIFSGFQLKEDVANVYNKLGTISFIQNDLQGAKLMAENALEMAEENGYLQEKSDALFLLSNVQYKMGQTDNGYRSLMRHTIVKDSLNEQKKAERFSELQISISTKEKEKELAIAEQEIKRREGFTYISLAIVFMVLVFMGIIVYNSRKVKKVNNLLTIRNQEINLQKEQIELQKNQVEQANEQIKLRNQQIEAINNDITSSINYAARIQKAMLPPEDFVKKYFKDGFVYFNPKEVVSGDFFWFSEVKSKHAPSLFRKKTNEIDSKIIIAVIDCTGHGVPGAFMSMLADAFMNQIVNQQKITSPDIILNELHKQIRYTLQQETTENSDGMDAAICVIDKDINTLEFAGAKNPLLYIQDGKVEKINGDHKSIGGIQKEEQRIFSKHVISIEKPTTFYIYSDGYQDQFGGPYGRKFMAKHFRDMLVENSNLPFDEQKQKLFDKLKSWRGDIIQMDDTTVVGIKI